MAVEEAAEGSKTRRRMDLNMYVGLPPLLRPPVWLDTTMISLTLMHNSTSAAPEAPRTVEPEESPAPPAAAYSQSNAPSTPKEHPLLHPIAYSWLDDNNTDGEEETDAPEARPVDGANVSRWQLLIPATGLEGDDLPVLRFVRPSRVAAAGMEIVNTNILQRPGEGCALIEAVTPELLFQRVIQISQQHSIVRPVSARSQGAASTDAGRLAQAIQCTHNSLQASRWQKLDENNERGNGAAKKDGPCDYNSGFECNICLDPTKEPVVTPCGDLFCWPCLYH